MIGIATAPLALDLLDVHSTFCSVFLIASSTRAREKKLRDERGNYRSGKITYRYTAIRTPKNNGRPKRKPSQVWAQRAGCVAHEVRVEQMPFADAAEVGAAIVDDAVDLFCDR